MPKHPDPDWYEGDLIRAMGISRETMLPLRKGLKEKEHWSTTSGVVRYTYAGVAAIFRNIGLTETQARGVLSQIDALRQVHGITVRVTATPRNTQIVRATRLSDGEEVTVSVGNSRRFRLGMEFLARPTESPLVYVLAERPPRSPNRY